MSENPFKEVFDRLNCDSGLIFVDTAEETRLIRCLYKEYLHQGSIQFWSVAQGLHEIDKSKYTADKVYPFRFETSKGRTLEDGTPTYGDPNVPLVLIENDCRKKLGKTSEKTIYILRDFTVYLQDPGVLRRLKDLIYLCAATASSIILVEHGIQVPEALEKDSVLVNIPYPSRKEILDIIKKTKRKLDTINKKLTETNQTDKLLNLEFNETEVARACAGLTEDQIINTLQYTAEVDRTLSVPRILEEKRSIINKSDVLEYWICDDSLDDIGGFKAIKKWFNTKKVVLNNPEAAEKFKAISPKGCVILGVQGAGKCQPLWSKILMADKTWKRIGDLSLGDKIQGPDGNKYPISGIFDHKNKPCYKIEFKDGRTTYCSDDHLWKIYNKNFQWSKKKGTMIKTSDGWKVVDTKELIRLLNSRSSTRKFYVPLLEDSNVGEIPPIDPYLLGILIGNGHIECAPPKITSDDPEIIEKIKDKLEWGYEIHELKNTENDKCSTYSIVNKRGKGHGKENLYTETLLQLGLLGKLNYEKFIPDVCYRFSKHDKIELIRGLIDSDGSADSSLTYSTTSPMLAAGVQELVRSIGGIAFVAHIDTKCTYKGEKREGKSSFRINMKFRNPQELVSLNRKKETLTKNYQYSDLKLEIVSVEDTGYTQDMRCIFIDNSDHLYITDNYIVTHNTAICKALAKSYNVGLIKLDIGRLFAGVVGASESNTRRALSQIEAVGGVVLLDEMEKGLSGAGSSNRTDGGTTDRVIASLLTWMSENHPGVFLVATMNDISNIKNHHPELLRRGRFGGIWFADVPTQEERKEIFEIHLKKSDRNPKKFNTEELSKYTYKDSAGEYILTGAEIESAIQDAIQEKFASKNGKEVKIGSKDDITDEDILRNLKDVIPITKIGKENIESMRRWASLNAKNVSDSSDEKKTDKTDINTSKINLREEDVEL